MIVKYRNSIQSFKENENGTVAVVFGLILTAFLAFAGLSVDQTRAYTVQADLQAAIDAAALSAAQFKMKHADSDARPTFDASLAGNWSAKASAAQPSILQFSDQNEQVQVTARTSLPTTFMALLGRDMLDVVATSTVQYGTGALEVALVLDNTYSMNGAKLSSLKDAATELVETIKPSAETTDHVKVSLVPFGQYVNVGLANRNESWISVENDHSETENECEDVRPIIDPDECSIETINTTKDGVPYSYQKNVCTDDAYGPEEEQCADETTNYVWTGCVGSRNDPLDTQDGGYGGDKIPGLLNTSCPSAIGPLSNVKSQVLDQIDAMTATGNTYIPSGLMWGWRTLSPEAPFTEGDANTGDEVKKVLVLMTDGANTKSPTYPEHDGSDASLADTLTTTACDNIKADNIAIYAVTFDVDDNDIKDLMKNCASGPVYYYDASDSAQLTAAFQDIGVSLAQLRFTN